MIKLSKGTYYSFEKKKTSNFHTFSIFKDNVSKVKCVKINSKLVDFEITNRKKYFSLKCVTNTTDIINIKNINNIFQIFSQTMVKERKTHIFNVSKINL